MTRPALVVLARAPVAGQGKTRLRPVLGDALVDQLAAAFLQDTLSWAQEGEWALLVAHHGPADGLRAAAPQAWLTPQRRGGLGERITAAIADAFATGAGGAVLIGTDSPTLPAALLDAAFAGLAGADATVVPARDGGWVALGVTRPLGRALDGVTWSSVTTCAETVRALRRSGRRTALLPPWHDVDELADLLRLRQELCEPAVARAPRTAAVLNQSATLAAALGRIAA